MKADSMNKMMKALFMNRKPIGVKLIAYQKEFNDIEAQYCDKKRTFCAMVQMAMRDDVLVKSDANSFSCEGGASALGIVRRKDYRISGRSYQASKMYSTLPVARNINQSMLHIENINYGVLVGPLDKMDDCDVVVMMGTSRQIMRVMQGYSYYYGAYDGLKSVGMQAVCSDLVSRPFNTNNINISLMCCGARTFTCADEGEMGIAVPIQMYDSVTDGIVKTINYMEYEKYKNKLKESYDCQKEFGIEINNELHYGKEVNKYVQYCEETRTE